MGSAEPVNMGTWQQIGDVARDLTEKLEEPFAVALCFREWVPATNGSDFVGLVAFNHPRDCHCWPAPIG